jgi:C1A family cysteine protease
VVGVVVDVSFFKSYKVVTIYNGLCVEMKNHCIPIVGYDEKGKNKL